MAYVPEQIPEEEKNKLANPNPTTPYPVAPQGGGSAGTGSNAAPGVGTSTQFGSNAAKLSDYLSANKDQVQNFGNQIAGNLSQGYDQTKGAIDQGFSGFNQQVNQGYTQDNPDLVNQAASNPTDFVKNKDNVSQFQSLFNDQYQGPQNFESTQPYTDINSNVNKAVENASLVGSPSGVSTYLTNNGYYPNATQGVKTLDSALLMGNQDAQKSIKAAAQPYSGLTDYLSGKTGEANKNVANAKTQADTIRQGAQDKFIGQNGIATNFQNTQNQKLSDAQKQYQDTIDRYSNLNGKAGLSDVIGLGANPDVSKINTLEENSSILGQPMSPNYGQFIDFNNPSGAPTAGNISSPDEIATSQALAQLTGNQGMGIQGGGQQYSAPTLGYNGKGLNDYLDNNISQNYSDEKAFQSLPQANVQAMKSLTPDQISSYLNGSPNFNPGNLAQMFPGQSFKQTVDVMIRMGMLPPSVLTGGTTPTGGGGTVHTGGINGAI